MTNNEKRAELTAEIMARTGIDEQMIDRLVRNFYSKVRRDPLIGPIFDARIQDWEPHLHRMCGFGRPLHSSADDIMDVRCKCIRTCR